MKKNLAFRINHERLAQDPCFAGVARILGTLGSIDSQVSFNHYCHCACRAWNTELPKGVGKTSDDFSGLLNRVNGAGDGVIPAPWGGVVITRHKPPAVEKYLVIRKGHYLALESHTVKTEAIEVVEGAGLLLLQCNTEDSLRALPLAPGDQFNFKPGDAHCLIGTENLLVFESSSDPLGMDQDLVFIYEPDAGAST